MAYRLEGCLCLATGGHLDIISLETGNTAWKNDENDENDENDAGCSAKMIINRETRLISPKLKAVFRRPFYSCVGKSHLPSTTSLSGSTYLLICPLVREMCRGISVDVRSRSSGSLLPFDQR